MTIGNKKDEALKKRMEALGISDGDLIEKFVMGSGAGGQKVNKTSSCVYLQHVPTGIHVKYHRERSREINRYMARVTLCTKIEERIKKRCRDRRMAAEKVRRQKRGRSRNSKNRMLEDKHRHSQKKTMRRPPQRED